MEEILKQILNELKELKSDVSELKQGQKEIKKQLTGFQDEYSTTFQDLSNNIDLIKKRC